MIQWKSIDSYLGREVQVALCSCHLVDDMLPAESLKNSLLLVVLDTPFEDDVRLQSFLSVLIKSIPLAIIIYGQGARIAFDKLITLESESKSVNHIMTNVLDKGTIGEALEVLLRATWPSDERFDEWTRYSVLIMDEFESPIVINTIKKLCS